MSTSTKLTRDKLTTLSLSLARKVSRDCKTTGGKKSTKTWRLESRFERNNFSLKASSVRLRRGTEKWGSAIIIESAKAAKFNSEEMRCGRPIKFEKWLAARRGRKERDGGWIRTRGWTGDTGGNRPCPGCRCIRIVSASQAGLSRHPLRLHPSPHRASVSPLIVASKSSVYAWMKEQRPAVTSERASRVSEIPWNFASFADQSRSIRARLSPSLTLSSLRSFYRSFYCRGKSSEYFQRLSIALFQFRSSAWLRSFDGERRLSPRYVKEVSPSAVCTRLNVHVLAYRRLRLLRSLSFLSRSRIVTEDALVRKFALIPLLLREIKLESTRVSDIVRVRNGVFGARASYTWTRWG